MKQFLLFIVTIALLSVPTTSMAQDIDHIKDLIDDGKYQQAAKMLRPLADGGNAEAQYLASTLFLEGKGVVRNPQQAFKYAKMAADNTENFPIRLNALAALSMMCNEGVGTKKDTAQAIRYATLMCKDVQNYFQLDKEYQKLVQYYKEHSDTMYFRLLAAKAGTEGDIATQRSEGIRMKEELIRCNLEGTGCAKDSLAALRLIDGQWSIKKEYIDEKSPKLNDYLKLVLSCSHGEGLGRICDKNTDLFFALLKKYFGVRNSESMPQNMFQEWLQGAEEGSPSAMYIVSCFYEQHGQNHDMSKSREWAEKAASASGNRGFFEERVKELKSRPLSIGEIYDGKVIVSTNQSRYDILAKDYEDDIHMRTIDVDVKQYTEKEIKEIFKKIRNWFDWSMVIHMENLPHYLKTYAKAKKGIGKPFQEGQYWASDGLGKNKEVILITVNSQGEITASTKASNLSKDEREKPHLFLVAGNIIAHVKQGKPVEYSVLR